MIDKLVCKRKELFKKDPTQDRRFVEYAARKVLSDAACIKQIRAKPWLLIELCLTIVDKNKKSVPFFLNNVQKSFISTFEAKGTQKPYFILKGRQQGFTSLITAMQLCFAITRKNFSGFTVADCTDNVNAIFNDKAKVVYNALPTILKPHEKYNSRKELFFDKLNSSWRIAAGGDATGRSRTLEFAHFSEVAFYDNEISEMQKGIGEALVQNAVIIYETTANGWNQAKDLWDSGGCENLFFEWWLTDEYRLSDTSVLNGIQDSELTKRVEWLRTQKGLDDYQLAWYVNKYNRYLDKNAIKQEYPCFAEEAFIASGDCVFEKQSVLDRLSCAPKPLLMGDFEYKIQQNQYSKFISDMVFVRSPSGAIKIYEHPNFGEKFVVGADTAGSGEDYFTAVVERISDFKTVATMHVKRIDDDLFAHQIYCLASYFNDACLVVECNFSTAPIRELVNLDYPNLFARHQGLDGLGFKTTVITRPLIISTLKAAFRENPCIEQSKDVLLEMLSFVVNKEGRAEAAGGKHDDLVMAKAIAHYICVTYDGLW